MQPACETSGCLRPQLAGDLADLPVDRSACGSAVQASAAERAHEHLQRLASALRGPGHEVGDTGLAPEHNLQLYTGWLKEATCRHSLHLLCAVLLHADVTQHRHPAQSSRCTLKSVVVHGLVHDDDGCTTAQAHIQLPAHL